MMNLIFQKSFLKILLISAFLFLVGATVLSVVCIIFEKCHKKFGNNQSADHEKIEEISSNQQQCNIELQTNQNDVQLRESCSEPEKLS